MNSGYAKRPARFGSLNGFKKIKIDFILNFELPSTFNQYKSNCTQIEDLQGSIINFVDEHDKDLIQFYQTKMTKTFGKGVKMAEITMAEVPEEMDHRVSSLIGLVKRDHKIVAYKTELTRRYFGSNLGLKYYFKNVNKSAKNEHDWKTQLMREIRSVPSEIIPKKIIKSWNMENEFISRLVEYENLIK